MRPEARAWLEQARADLESARANVKGPGFHVAAFLSHQVAEKALKALYIQAKRESAPHTHNLIELALALECPQELVSELRVINADYLTARYPDAANGIPAWNFDARIAGEHVKIAAEALAWVEEELTTR